MMMMSTLDESFSLEAPPFNRIKKKRKKIKPTLQLYKQELRRRDPKIGLSNKKLENVLALLRGNLRVEDPADVSFVKQKAKEYTEMLVEAFPDDSTTTAGSNFSRIYLRKNDRMRFVECMVLDSVKPLYLKVNEVMTRHEMDGRNSTNVQHNFYDRVCEEYNTTSFVPVSRLLPDLHPDFENAYDLPLSEEYLMTADRAKKLISMMKGRIARMSAN